MARLFCIMRQPASTCPQGFLQYFGVLPLVISLFATRLQCFPSNFVSQMRRIDHLFRHRLATCIMLVVVLSMFTHMVVPHHHHARYVVLVCLHAHHAEAGEDAPHCPDSGVDCQQEDAAGCLPCDSLMLGNLHSAQRNLHALGLLPPHLLSWHSFLPLGWLSCPAPLVTYIGMAGRLRTFREFLPCSSYGLIFGLRAPPRGC